MTSDHVIIPRIVVLDAKSKRGPEIRTVSMSLWTNGKYSAVRFSADDLEGGTPSDDLHHDQVFVAGMNMAVNEILAMSEIVGEPFRDMVLKARQTSYEDEISPVFGYSVAGRPSERAAAIIREHAEQIGRAGDDYSSAEEQRIRRTVLDPQEPEERMSL